MKRYKRIAVLAAVLVLICAATFALSFYEKEQERIRTSDAVVLEIAADSVDSIAWKYQEDGFAFRRSEEGWLYDDDAAFPVSSDKMNDILGHFEAFGVSFIIEEVEDYGQYGLDEPECTVSITAGDSDFEIRLGDFSKMDQQRYVDIGDGNVYLVREDPAEYMPTALSALIRHDDTPGFETVESISFSGEENYSIVRVEDSRDSYQAEDIYFTEIDGEMKPLDTEDVTEYLNTVTGLELLNYASYNVTEEELADFGLSEPELSVTVNYSYEDEDENTVSDSCTFHIGRNAAELAAAEEAEAKEEEIPDVTKYVRIGDSQIVYTVGDADYVILSQAGYNDLRHREIIWADFADITQLDITLEGEEHTLHTAPDEEDEENILWYYGEEEVDIGRVQSTLESLKATDFTDGAPTDIEELRLTVHLDSEDFPTVEIALYRQDGSHCLAVVDGESVALVERSAVMDLVETVQAIVLN